MKWKGEEGYALYGLVAGFCAALAVLAAEAALALPEEAEFAVGLAVLMLFLASMGIKFASIFTHHAVFSPNADDSVLGLALGFDIPLVGMEILQGHLPFAI